MGVKTAAGTTIAINATIPATFDQAGYEAVGMTAGWKVIGEVTDPGEFGRKYNEIKHTPVNTRATQKFKGGFDEGQMTVQMGLDESDEGQDLMRTALDDDDDYSFRVQLPSGVKYYFQAKTLEFTIGGLTVESIVTATAVLSLTTSNTGVGIVKVEPV